MSSLSSQPESKRAKLGKFGKPQASVLLKPQGAPPTTSITVLAQALPAALLKSVRGTRFIMPIISKAEAGPFKSFRLGQGEKATPGPPFTFAFPRITSGGGETCHAAKFGFAGFLELPGCPKAGSFGELLSPSPAFKVFGNNLYAEMEKHPLVAKDAGPPTASLGSAWGDLELAKVALVTNTEAFFNTQRFQQAVQMAACDQTFTAGADKCFDLAKSRQNGLQCNAAAPSRLFTTSLSRYVVVLNPPALSSFGASVVGVQGGSSTERGTSRPYKIILAQAGKPGGNHQTVMVWPSDAAVWFGEADGLGERLKTTSAVLLIDGGVSSENEVEYTMRAAAVAVDESTVLEFKSNVLKSLFNDLAHNATLMQKGQSKFSYEKSVTSVLEEGHYVHLAVQRASEADALLLDRAKAIALVRDKAKAEAEDADEATKAMADLVTKESSEEQLADALAALDKYARHTTTLESAREQLADDLVFEEEDEEEETDSSRLIKIELVALTAFEAMDKSQAIALQPMVKRSALEMEAVDSATMEVMEDEADLCEGLD